jgi:signal transduction histidine kinase
MTDTELPRSVSLESQLLQVVEEKQADLINLYNASLRETLFTNRAEVTPRTLRLIAAAEAQALVNYFRDPEFSALDYGIQLCAKGVSEQTVLRLGQATRQFVLTYFTGEDVAQALNIVDLYQNGVMQGFIQAREKNILAEQERLRGALQVAVGRYTVEIREVQDIAKKANEANEFKSQFIASMSHELRTPLGAILGLAEMLQQSVYGVLSPPQQDIVQRIIDNVQALKQLFTELLDQSQIESGHLRLKQKAFSPQVLVKKVHSNYLAMALQKGLSMWLEVAPELPETVIGDQARIEQVLSNLVVNAIKFTRQGGITIRAFKGDDSQWVIQVKDTGIGIAVEHQAQIFEPFRQADETTSRKYGGVGLGLAIAQQLVHAMNGSIQVESKPGQGSIFTICLPIREDQNR